MPKMSFLSQKNKEDKKWSLKIIAFLSNHCTHNQQITPLSEAIYPPFLTNTQREEMINPSRFGGASKETLRVPNKQSLKSQSHIRRMIMRLTSTKAHYTKNAFPANIEKLVSTPLKTIVQTKTYSE